jgi:hypothetical protein
VPLWVDGRLDRYRWRWDRMIILGIILLIIGFVVKIAIVWTIGIIVLAVGLVLALFGALGRGVGGRRHYWLRVYSARRRRRKLALLTRRAG